MRAGVDWPRRAACRECRNAQEAEHRERQRQRAVKRTITALGSCQNLERLEAVVGVLLQICGGVDGLANELVSLLQQAPPGSVTRRRVHLGVLTAMSVLHEGRAGIAKGRAKGTAEEPLDVESLSDGELLERACEPLRRLDTGGCLGTVLRHMVTRGEISSEMLSSV